MPLELARNTSVSVTSENFITTAGGTIQELTAWKGTASTNFTNIDDKFKSYEDDLNEKIKAATSRLVGLEKTLDSVGFIIRIKADDTDATAANAEAQNGAAAQAILESQVLAKAHLTEDGFIVQQGGSVTQGRLTADGLYFENSDGTVMIDITNSDSLLRNLKMVGSKATLLTHDIKKVKRKEFSTVVADGSTTVQGIGFFWKEED